MKIHFNPVRQLISSESCLKAAQWIVCAQIAYHLVIPIMSKIYGTSFNEMPPIPKLLTLYSSTASLIGLNQRLDPSPQNSLYRISYLILINAFIQLVKIAYSRKKTLPPSFLKNLSTTSNDKEKLENQDQRIPKILNQLSSLLKPHVMLIGKPGIGKTSIVEIIARKLQHSSMKESPLYQKNIYLLDKNIFLSNIKYLGQFNEKIAELLNFCKKNKNAIIFIDEIHTILGDGKTSRGTSSLGESLKESLSRKEIHVIGATTVQESQDFMTDSALNRRFQEINIQDMDPECCAAVLKNFSQENYLSKKIDSSFLNLVIKVSSSYQPDRGQPDKALTLLDKLLKLPTDFSQPINSQMNSSHQEKIIEDLSNHCSLSKIQLKKIVDNFIETISSGQMSQQTIVACAPAFLQDLSFSCSVANNLNAPFTDQVAKFLMQNQSIIIQGQPKSGKTSAVELIAHHLKPQNKTIYLLNYKQFISNSSSTLENHVTQLQNFFKQNTNHILFIDNLPSFLSSIQTHFLNFENLLKQIQLIATESKEQDNTFFYASPKYLIDILRVPLPPIENNLNARLLMSNYVNHFNLPTPTTEELIEKTQANLFFPTTIGIILYELKKQLFLLLQSQPEPQAPILLIKNS
ncbi:MAG: AAA family ATPase [Candidatus Rhabdochlamydia sp.]